jgi:hypothetical protein
MFSTNTLTPNFSVNLGASMRARMSVPPPGVKGTINLMGLSDLGWANSGLFKQPRPNTKLNKTRVNRYMSNPIQKMKWALLQTVAFS